jgi:hypothetical protein
MKIIILTNIFFQKRTRVTKVSGQNLEVKLSSCGAFFPGDLHKHDAWIWDGLSPHITSKKKKSKKKNSIFLKKTN